MTVFVDIAMALICFAATPGDDVECHKVLVGPSTPTGSYALQQRLVDDPLYGGDILQFREDATSVFAIHRVWLGRPAEKRDQRIKSEKVAERKITKGCINVTEETYDLLMKCCSSATLIID